MKPKPNIPRFSASEAMPFNYAQDLADRVLSRQTISKSEFPKRYTYLFLGAAGIVLLVGLFYRLNVSKQPPPIAEAIPKQVLEAYLWNEEQISEADLMLVLTGAEFKESAIYGLETDPLIF
jgi:hypothetical protein